MPDVRELVKELRDQADLLTEPEYPHIGNLMRRAAEALERFTWKPIADVTPTVLERPRVAIVVDGAMMVGAYYKSKRGWFDCENLEPINPTHYMLLPDPPQVQDGH